MADRTREQLLGYVLDALDESERNSVEYRLERDPKLRQELARVREGLQPLWVTQPNFAPPPGLAARTCQLIASYPTAPANSAPEELTVPAGALREAEPTTANWATYSGWLDLAVAAGLVVTVSLLIFPAIQNSRFNARLATCRDRLRQLGVALSQYSERHEDFFPPVYDQGSAAGAGIYAPVLVTTGLVDDSRWFVCPGSPLAESRQFRVPLLEELVSASPGDELRRLRSSMGGSFGYSLGFFENGRVYSTRNLRRPYFALMADVPSAFLANRQSLNHDGRGQNVLFEDGRIAFYTTPRPHARADDVFVNDVGYVAAGRNRNDSVVGCSTSVPCLGNRTYWATAP